MNRDKHPNTQTHKHAIHELVNKNKSMNDNIKKSKNVIKLMEDKYTELMYQQKLKLVRRYKEELELHQERLQEETSQLDSVQRELNNK